MKIIPQRDECENTFCWFLKWVLWPNKLFQVSCWNYFCTWFLADSKLHVHPCSPKLLSATSPWLQTGTHCHQQQSLWDHKKNIHEDPLRKMRDRRDWLHSQRKELGLLPMVNTTVSSCSWSIPYPGVVSWQENAHPHTPESNLESIPCTIRNQLQRHF